MPNLRARLARSAATTTSAAGPDIDAWLADKRARPSENTVIPLDELAEPGGWGFEAGTGNVTHHSGRFFTVEGLHVETGTGPGGQWWQPILVQRDIAILGIITRDIGGVLHFLLQAKMEPGNADVVQLSPTVQATSSNYSRVHGGRASRYAEFFTEAGRGRVLVDSLQSEQGEWFHLKRNRNIVVEVTGDVPEHEDFCWLTLGQIHRLLRRPNVINMDARSVLGCLPSAEPQAGPGRHTTTEILSWFTERKAACDMSARLVPLAGIAGWRRDADRIAPRDGGPFSIVGVRVHSRTREVHRWRQPLLAPHGLGLAALVVREIDGVPHALVRAEAMPGYRDAVELGPTVRHRSGPGTGAEADSRPEFLDHVLAAGARVRYDVVQSEEGGRFLHAETRYLVVEAGDDFPVRVPDDYLWITAAQLLELQRHSYYVGVEARTLLFCLGGL